MHPEQSYAAFKEAFHVQCRVRVSQTTLHPRSRLRQL